MILRICCVAFFALNILPAFSQDSNTWMQVKNTGRGAIIVYWYESKPFIYRDANGKMKGIEYEITEGFKKFLKDAYNINLQIIWKEAKSFGDTYATIRYKKQEGSFGISAFSITNERKRQVDFSPPYMSDISVLITSKNIPIVKSSEEFNQVFSGLTAVTIKGTTYERDILNIKRDWELPFKIKYIPSSENILKTIEKMDNAFGFIDLPIYLMFFNNNSSVNVKRQNLFPIKREGYAIIYPKNSDWNIPLKEYFSDEKFKTNLEKVISEYLEIEVYHFIESLAIQSNDEVVLLTKEKEIQYRDLLGKSEQIHEETQRRNFLIALVIVIFISLLIIVVLYRKRNKDHLVLIEQKEQIESQGRNIELQNLQLEKRNQRLIALNEEKNNLIRILAHDLRTPINHVQGLAQVFLHTNETLPEDQAVLIRHIIEAAVRLNKMISNILDIDAIENNRVNIFIDNVMISSLVQQVTKSFEKQASVKDIQLVYTTNNENCIMKGDSLLLTEIFENLLSNAIKFSGNSKRIEITVKEMPGHVTIFIKDNGPGLTQEDMAMLFKKFQRLSAQPTGGERSTGLGLSIVKKYVELMNGHVWCESQEGHGANFIVEFRI